MDDGEVTISILSLKLDKNDQVNIILINIFKTILFATVTFKFLFIATT